MKKLLCIWMALLLLACPALAEEDSVKALIDQLDAYLALNEQLCAIRAGMYRCVEEFYAEQDYESLVNLRIVSDQAQQAICALTAPEMALTDAQLLHLMTLGVETDAVEVEIGNLHESIEGALIEAQNIEMTIDGALLSRGQLERMYAFAQVNRQSMELEMQYACLFVNYMLLPVSDSEQVGEFWEVIPQRYPTLGSAWQDWDPSAASIEARTVQLLEDYPDLIRQATELVGADSYSVDQVKNSIRQGDLDALTADALAVDGMPTVLPLPSGWLDPTDAGILAYRESDGDLPEIIILWEPDVSLEAFDAYVQQLLDAGAAIYRREGSDDAGWKYVLVYGQQVLMLERDPLGCASITYEPEFLSLETEAYRLCRP